MIELAGLEGQRLRVESCLGLRENLHTSGYVNPISEKTKGISYDRIYIRIPDRPRFDSDRGTMVVSVGNRHKKIDGQYEHLLAIFTLIRQLRDGALYCKHCKRVVPDQCQIVALINFLET